MANVTFDDLISEAERSFESVEVEDNSGNVFVFRSLAVLPRARRTAVLAAVKVVNGKSKTNDPEKQEAAIDSVLLSVVSDADGFRPVLDELPLGAKAKLMELWAKGTQAPEA
ncbi:phage tail assembly protein [Streptomyces sp. NPDC002644]